MVSKFIKLFLNLQTLYRFLVTHIFFIGILILLSVPAFSNNNNTERNLAYKYCKSIESNMFKGLDDERILKYEYFFNSVNKENINEGIEILKNFTSEVEKICSYKLNSEEKEDFRKELETFLFNN